MLPFAMPAHALADQRADQNRCATSALTKPQCSREIPFRRSSLQRGIVSHVLALATEAEKGVRYDEAEISRAYTRICCMSCSDWRADAVRAKVAAFLIAHWDGQNPKPPSPRARRAQRQRRYRQRVRFRPATR